MKRGVLAAAADYLSVLHLLRYDPDTGLFYKRGSRGERVVGASDKTKHGYIVISLGKHGPVRAHRLAYYMMNGRLPDDGMVIDHINGDPTDNRWSNLRLVHPSINSQNRTKTSVDTRSGCLGVEVRHRQKGEVYRAKISANGRSINLGTYPTMDQAKDAYLTAKRKMHEGCTI